MSLGSRCPLDGARLRCPHAPVVARRRALENGEDQAVSWEEFPHHVSEGARTSLANTAFLHLQVCPDLRASAARVVPSRRGACLLPQCADRAVRPLRLPSVVASSDFV